MTIEKTPRPGAATGLMTLRYSGPAGSQLQWVALVSTKPFHSGGGSADSVDVAHDGVAVGGVRSR